MARKKTTARYPKKKAQPIKPSKSCPPETEMREKPAPASQDSLKNIMDIVKPDGMGSFLSLYLDPVENGFKLSIWSAKEGLLEGFVPESEMPPLVRRILFRRTESLSPGESIELIGRREDDIALIAAEPIEHPQVRGILVADVTTKNSGEVHLKITLLGEKKPREQDVNIDNITELFNQDVRKNMKISEYELRASELVKEIWEAKDLTRNPKNRKTIASVSKAAKTLSSLSKRFGFVKISQLSESMSVLFDAYLENGAADKSSLPIVMQTVEMLDRMVGDLSQGPDVDYLVSRISRKDSAG